MRDPPKLSPDRGVYLRPAMPVDIAPERGDPIQVFLTMNVLEPAAASGADHDRRLALVLLHLRERMPDVPFIPLFQPRISIRLPSHARNTRKLFTPYKAPTHTRFFTGLQSPSAARLLFGTRQDRTATAFRQQAVLGPPPIAMYHLPQLPRPQRTVGMQQQP